MEEYFNKYKNMIWGALDTVDESSLSIMRNEIQYLAKMGIPLFVCGNGGSAAITEHMSCDHTKGIAMDTDLFPYVIPLQSNVSLNTAISNDIGYEEVFSKQIEWWPQKDFGLLVVSSSGNSPNIINALNTANRMGAKTMAMVGFDGGKAAELAKITVHVRSDNYGVVEDCHQIIMHSIAQNIRLSNKLPGISPKL